MALHLLVVPPGGGKTRPRRLQRLLRARRVLVQRPLRKVRAAHEAREALLQRQGRLPWKSARLKS